MANMVKKTNPVPRIPSAPVDLDATDRKLLGLLAGDSSQSYAELGEKLHLSAPAVFERVKRLKRDKVILATGARLDGAKLGRPLLCFVQVITNTIARTRQVAALATMPDIEEVHTVTGEAGLFLKVRMRDTQALEDLLARVHEVEGVAGTRTQVVLSTLLERGPSPVAA
jgi:Lrp/AsnC family transcriptional regulator, leucine-responsive regulatory protein